MHELSIALSVVEGAEEEVERQGGGQVCSVHLRIGPLSGVVKEALRFSWDLAIDGTQLEATQLVIEEVPVTVRCSDCGSEGSPISIQCLHCARCGGSHCSVITGDELEFTALELAGIQTTA